MIPTRCTNHRGYFIW